MSCEAGGGDWDPEQYARFREERSQPFRDLLGLVAPRPAMRVIDLGCGSGELTLELHGRLGAARTLGIDSSASMLARGSRLAAAGFELRESDIASWEDEAGSWDLVFSNAALQWLPDHELLVPRICRALGDRGQLAVQVPANHDHPSHTLAVELSRESPFREALGGETRQTNVLPPERYSELLHAIGFRRQHVRLQVYPHLLEGPHEVVEWVRGTMLTWFRRRLPDALYAEFLAQYQARFLSSTGPRSPCFYPFKRILLWGEM